MDKTTIIILGLSFIALCLCFYEVCFVYDKNKRREIEALDKEIERIEEQIRERFNSRRT
jgi:hypothetical protein